MQRDNDLSIPSCAGEAGSMIRWTLEGYVNEGKGGGRGERHICLLLFRA